MKIPVILHSERIEITPYWANAVKRAVREHGGPIRGQIESFTPESKNMRAYVMGCLIPLLVHLDGNDYRDSETCERYFEHYKMEFTPELLKIDGKIRTFGKSSKGSKALKTFADKLQDYLSEHYAIGYDHKVISADFYKEWRDRFAMDSTDTFIEYCQKLKLIE